MSIFDSSGNWRCGEVFVCNEHSWEYYKQVRWVVVAACRTCRRVASKSVAAAPAIDVVLAPLAFGHWVAMCWLACSCQPVRLH